MHRENLFLHRQFQANHRVFDTLSVFPVFFDVLLAPFVSTVIALVHVLEFFNVSDDRSAFLNYQNRRSLRLPVPPVAFQLYRI